MSHLAPHGSVVERAKAFVDAGFGPCVQGSTPCGHATGLQHEKLVCMLSGQAQFVTMAGARLCPMSTPVADTTSPPTSTARRRDQPYLVR